MCLQHAQEAYLDEHPHPCMSLTVYDLAAAGQWKTAAEVFEGMASSACKPDAVTFSTLITAYDKGGQWPLALQVCGSLHASSVCWMHAGLLACCTCPARVILGSRVSRAHHTCSP